MKHPYKDLYVNTSTVPSGRQQTDQGDHWGIRRSLKQSPLCMIHYYYHIYGKSEVTICIHHDSTIPGFTCSSKMVAGGRTITK
jgi:hypothetical protein